MSNTRSIPHTDHLGNTFESRKAMCNYYHIPPTVYAYRIKKLKWSVEKALTTPPSASNNPRCITCVDHLGNAYPSVAALCEHYNITVTTYIFRLKNHWTLERALTTPIRTSKKECKDHLGNSFPSTADMCKFHGINKATFDTRRKNGMSLEDALNPNRLPIGQGACKTCKDHEGHVFSSIKEMCEYHHITITTYHYRQTHGKSLKETLTPRIISPKNIQKRPKKEKPKIIDHLGHEFPSKAAMLQYHNVLSESQFNTRIKNGWSLEKALTTPTSVNKLIKETNDLQTMYPEIAAQWHPTKNGNLIPSNICAGSSKIVWWRYPYDVPNDYPIEHLRGKHFDFEWKDKIVHRASGQRPCPYLKSKKLIWPGFNDLAATYPDIAAEWNYDKNNNLTPSDIMPGSGKKVWWKCANGHEWETRVYSRTIYKFQCPYCLGKYAISKQNDLQTKYPQIAKEWYYERNSKYVDKRTKQKLLPNNVKFSSNQNVWWKCKNGHEWQEKISSRTTAQNECPFCSERMRIIKNTISKQNESITKIKPIDNEYYEIQMNNHTIILTNKQLQETLTNKE